jgi:hypothetical protein
LLRSTLSTAGDVVQQIDAAARRLDESSGTALAAVKEKLAELDRKTAASAAKTQEFDAVTRKAQAAADRLERALRSGRGRIPPATGTVPREQVEPLGFTEHMAARSGGAAAENDAVPHELIQRILAAQMPLGGPAHAAGHAGA